MSTSPYPGLRPFHRDEADIFFGRDEQVDQLLIRLGKSRFLAVVGPSGCGKSSLAHTGLLNALEAGFLADVGLHWRIATMQPGSHPMRNLAAALVKHIGPNTDTLNTDKECSIYPPLPSGEGRGEGFQKSANPDRPQYVNTNTNSSSESQVTSFSDTGTASANEKPQHDDTAFLLATLRRGPLGLIEALQEQPLPENTNLLLVVDQFEEIFRYREHQDRDEADAFIALLLRSFQDSAFPVYIVITMRSDFLGDCALFPGLPEALNDSQFLTPRLNREQRRLAITGPARVFGGDVEPALVNRLLNDMGADPDQLPVLEHALMRLWTDASKRETKPVLLKLDDYEKLGGWDNTLSNHADEAFAELDEKQKTIAEIMFRSLTERSGARRDTRRPVSLQAVTGIAGVDIEQVIPVIEVFRRAERSFVMPPHGQPLTAETMIDISHESLIRQWQRMKKWVEQEAQSADTYRRLEQTALLHSQKRAGLLQALDWFPVLEWKRREKPSVAWAARYGENFDRVMHFLADSQLLADSQRMQMLNSIMICISAHKADYDLGLQVRDILLELGANALTAQTEPALNQSLGEFRTQLDIVIDESEGMIIVYGQAPPMWIQAQYAQARKVTGLRDKVFFTALLDGPPIEKPSVGLGGRNLMTLECRDGLLRDEIERFVNALLAGT